MFAFSSRRTVVGYAIPINPQHWLLPFSAADPAALNGDGRPWADGTAMAARAAQGRPPWDAGCRVTTYVGGYDAMCAIRDTFEAVIVEAKGSGRPFGDRGHVYIAGWRLNSQRDLSDDNAWKTGPWGGATVADKHDQTAMGLVLRLMQAGIRVRIMVWFPDGLKQNGTGLAHPTDHASILAAVRNESGRLGREHGLTAPLGVVALDGRVATGTVAGSHHQKTVVVRGVQTHVAFCGGVDMGFTRRDAPAAPPGDPAAPRFYEGDWQSGKSFPAVTPRWPRDGQTNYASVDALTVPLVYPDSDLPLIGTLPDGATLRAIYGSTRHVWHDQHLRLEGPIVKTLEEQFDERWRDTAKASDLAERQPWGAKVWFSTPQALDGDGAIVPLPAPLDPPPPTGAGWTSTVQMWRTIPYRDDRTGPPFERGEFTVMAGYVRAATRASQLLWIFDQYFWSRAYGLMLAWLLQTKPDLRIVIVLPPWADNATADQQGVAHRARHLALEPMRPWLAAGERAAVYDLWDPRVAPGRGIYCHAKAHTYDGALLVCGSANINRRSFQCDTELACAVNDPAVVSSHQRHLWHLLFADVPADAGGTWPEGLDLDAGGDAGARFFTAFKRAATHPSAYVRPDPWLDSPPAIANGLVRPLAAQDLAFRGYYYRLFDATSITTASERPVGEMVDGRPVIRPPRLDEISRRVDLVTRGILGGAVHPYRRTSHDWELLEE